LLETSPDAVVVTDVGGRIVFANEQAERMFGYRPEELVGNTVDILVPERLRAGHAVHRERYSAAPRVRPMGTGLSLFGQKRNGEQFPVEISLSPVTVGDDTLLSANIRDITERVRSEAAMRRLQGQLLSAVESIQGAFALFDDGDRLVLCNSAYRQVMGHPQTDELVGKTFDDLLTASVASGAFAVDATSAEALATRWRAHHASPEGALDLETAGGDCLRVVERRTADGGIVATIWNVTDEVSHEDELRLARSQAEAASAAKTEFLASMSHELRTPLNAILGFAQLLRRDKKAPLSSRQHERVEHVLAGGEHLLRLIDDVLDLSRIEAGRVLISLEPVTIASVLDEVKDTLDSLAAKSGRASEISVAIDLPDPETCEVVADRTRFKQVLLNYGSNAIKYGKNGGKVAFAVHARGNSARISVTDDGIGIPRDKQAVVFQPFQRAGQETGPIEGTGIGLVISKRLAELMHGQVGFESEPGRGSCFWIDLPLQPSMSSAPAPATVARVAREQGLARGGRRRQVVVYIEDNPSNVAFMADLLDELGHVELLTAPSAELGVELVRARRPDAVIMDINLPGMSGFEATRRLASWPETRDIPVVALSAAALLRDAARAGGAGFYRYLTKPVKVDELTALLEELLGRDTGSIIHE
jgi:PAS domain S-box-containing protein